MVGRRRSGTTPTDAAVAYMAHLNGSHFRKARDREYYLVQLTRTGIKNRENAYWAERDIDSHDVMSRYALED
ncbi:hypothetical protein SAMN05216299_11232 [Nitrosospira sp. Nsp14]|nr:hypothetical protein SAMN05216299_11232 [Nitrosospira sp. Nsp14]